MPQELPLSHGVQEFIDSIDCLPGRRVSPKEKESDDICRRAVEMIVSEVIGSREALTKSKRKDISLIAALRASYHSRASRASSMASSTTRSGRNRIYRPRIRRRASAHGMSLARPESIALTLRLISSAQAASASSSQSWSRLSSSDPAKAARASAGRRKASSRSLDSVSVICIWYQDANRGTR